jgi:uncharacterized protein involved in exopolysaccharide biosynthesis
MEEEINLLEYIQVIKKRKKLIIFITGVSVLCTMIISLIIPKTYKSTTTLLPPQKTKDIYTLPSIIASAGIPFSLGNIFTEGITSSKVFIGILKSRIMAEDVIKKFNLMKVYKVKDLSSAVEILQNNTIVKTTKEGIIEISVIANSPQLAQAIAKFYVENLDRLNQKLIVTDAKRNRMFIEKRMKETSVALKKAEDALAEFQASNKLISLDKQTVETIEKIANLEGEIIATEIRLGMLKEYATNYHPEFIQLKSKLAHMKKQLAKLQYIGKYSLPAFSDAPKVGLKLTRLLREVKTQETIYNLLTQQYEQAKIIEARDIPTVVVLDPASLPGKKYKPKIKQNMLLAGCVSLLIAIIMAFFLEYIAKVRQQGIT